METSQIVLQLTEDKEILNQLRKNKALKKNADGQEFFVTQFDGKIFEFKKGIPITLNATAAKALRRASAVIIGASVDGEYQAALEQVETFLLGEESSVRRKNITSCPICLKDMKNLPNLAKHLASKAHKEDRPDLYPDVASIDYNTPLVEEKE